MRAGPKLLCFITFCGLIGLLFYYSGDPKLSIEVVSLGFFAAVGALSGGFEFALDWLSRASRRTPPSHFYSVVQFGLVPTWILAGFALAGGGGGIRRGIEIVVAFVAERSDNPLKICYDPALTVLWPGQYEGYGAVTFGIGIGAILSVLSTHRVSVVTVQGRQSDLDAAVHYVDYLATAFFAAYGIEAAMKFTSSLPLSAATQFTFLAVTAIFVIPSSILMGCGGGLLKGIVIDLVLLRPRDILTNAKKWFFKPAPWVYAGISFLGLVFYELLDRTPLQFGTCAKLDDFYLLLTTLACSLIAAAAVWGTAPQRPPSGLPTANS
jgi:hypothetical protein